MPIIPAKSIAQQVANSNDCGFFVMMFMKYYNPDTRELVVYDFNDIRGSSSGSWCEVATTNQATYCYDHRGNPLIMVWRLLHHCRDVEEAEAVGCLEAIRLADNWPSEVPLLIDTDCANVVAKVATMLGKKVNNNTSKDGVVIQRVTREVGGGGTSYPVLTKTNYSD
ncbi:hypothetical protein GUJ93_ZPchr0011g27432 [Zizania palustris]|uniref:RNase H type-1 domain-containing protein n=1 Tax=Zizania palustris TaxID=103762 RepID=A0A8J6BRE4_ZIZPA|nr:hypothetical protein GUJ93_ZPchr0011g27432 [Zizania palustris]